jgi:hypothetical protein
LDILNRGFIRFCPAFLSRKVGQNYSGGNG